LNSLYLNHKPEKIILASGNQKKVVELQLLLEPLDISIVPQSGFNIKDADETGLTFVENAIIKARHAAQISGLPAIADDSGIEVDGTLSRWESEDSDCIASELRPQPPAFGNRLCTNRQTALDVQAAA